MKQIFKNLNLDIEQSNIPKEIHRKVENHSDHFKKNWKFIVDSSNLYESQNILEDPNID